MRRKRTSIPHSGATWKVWQVLRNLLDRADCSAARGYDLTFGSPMDDKLSLFHLGERAYDHILILPPKSKKGMNYLFSLFLF